MPAINKILFQTTTVRMIADGLMAHCRQLVQHCTGIRRGHGFESRSGLNFFSGFNFTTA